MGGRLLYTAPLLMRNHQDLPHSHSRWFNQLVAVFVPISSCNACMHELLKSYLKQVQEAMESSTFPTHEDSFIFSLYFY